MLWLVGLMGSGKSTIGPLAADLLGVPFIDTDALVEQRTARTIPELFADGEGAFRDAESCVIDDVADGPPAVVATGGGAVVRPGNRERMKASGRVVWLRASPEILVARVGDAEGRPLLADSPARRLAELSEERHEAYLGASDLVIDTDCASVGDVVEEVVAAWPVS